MIRIADYKGKVQGRCYRLWQSEEDTSKATFQIEEVWGTGSCGVFWKSESTGIKGFSEAKRYLKGIGAERM